MPPACYRANYQYKKVSAEYYYGDQILYSSTGVKQAMQRFIPTQPVHTSLTSNKAYSAILFSQLASLAGGLSPLENG